MIQRPGLVFEYVMEECERGRGTAFLEKLRVVHLVRKHIFYWTRRFVIVNVRIRQFASLLSRRDPVHIPTSHFFRLHLILFFQLRLCSPSAVLFIMTILYALFITPMRAKCSNHPITLYFVTFTIRPFTDNSCRNVFWNISFYILDYSSHSNFSRHNLFSTVTQSILGEK
jgi:hypothetical protein